MIEPSERAGQSCWVLSDGRAGNENPCLGLAEALGLEPEVKRIKARAPWRWLPPGWTHPTLRAIDPRGDRLAPPWPDLLIASGRQSVGPALAVRRAGRGLIFAVQIQKPMIDPRRFDLVVVPDHDRLSGPNVLVTKGSMHRVTEARLAAAKQRFAGRLAHLPSPRVAVMIGGTSKAYRMTARIARQLGGQLAELARDGKAGLMVTPSRRTGAQNQAILRDALSGLPVEIWDGAGENPYFGYLALADALIVTSDSVNMVSEAAATGKPVHTVELDGGSAKFQRFHASLREAGITRLFTGTLESWRYPPFDEPRQVAEMIARRLAARA